ncbi:hypothetical protein CDAR_32321 [Caerostris darwini]|uniref:Uncharacterized protein n=1 Tax=Caerostris darwini TaxID=1538125 RepID=A0AAV4WMN0_9ARAC|nr:hypothetical protein CDAR_32321 [Caerostris darwini]
MSITCYTSVVHERRCVSDYAHGLAPYPPRPRILVQGAEPPTKERPRSKWTLRVGCGLTLIPGQIKRLSWQ